MNNDRQLTRVHGPKVEFFERVGSAVLERLQMTLGKCSDRIGSTGTMEVLAIQQVTSRYVIGEPGDFVWIRGKRGQVFLGNVVPIDSPREPNIAGG